MQYSKSTILQLNKRTWCILQTGEIREKWVHSPASWDTHTHKETPKSEGSTASSDTKTSHWSLSVQFSSVQVLSRVQLFATPLTAARQASLSITNSRSLLKLMSIKSVMPSNHLILCHTLLLLPSVFPSISIFSNESVICIRWPKYWSFQYSTGVYRRL